MTLRQVPAHQCLLAPLQPPAQHRLLALALLALVLLAAASLALGVALALLAHLWEMLDCLEGLTCQLSLALPLAPALPLTPALPLAPAPPLAPALPLALAPPITLAPAPSDQQPLRLYQLHSQAQALPLAARRHAHHQHPLLLLPHPALGLAISPLCLLNLSQVQGRFPL